MRKLIPVVFFSLILLGCNKQNLEEELKGSSFKSDYTVAEKLIEKSRASFEKDPDEAIENAYAALSLSEEIFYLKGQQKSHNILHWLYLNKFDDFEKATFHNEAYKRVTTELKEDSDLALLNYKKGYTLYRQNKYAEAVPYLFEARDLYLLQGDFEKEAYSLYTLSRIFEKVGKHDDGLFYLNKASENLDDKFLWTVYHLKGSLYLEIGNLKSSLYSYEKAKDIVFDLDLPSKKLKVLNDLARVSIMLENFAESAEYIEQGIQLSQKQNNNNYLALFYLKKGFQFQEKGDFNEAIAWNKKAEHLAKAIGNYNHIAAAYLALSYCYSETGNIPLGLTYAEKGLKLKGDSKDGVTVDLLHNLSHYSGVIGDSVSYHKYQGKLKDISLYEYANSQLVAVTKAELAYKEKTELAKYDAYIEDVRKEIADDERRGKFYLMAFGFMCACVLLLIAIRRPAQFFMKNAERAMLLIEDLHAAFKKRLAGEGPPLPKMKPLTKPELPDERDIHNLWRKDRHGRKGDKDKGKEDPAPGLDDD